MKYSKKKYNHVKTVGDVDCSARKPFALVSVFASFCHRYVRQFREIFTEEGRRQVKITHQVPGRAPVVSYTQVCNTAALATTKSTGSVSTTQPASSAAQVDVGLIFVLSPRHIYR